RLASRVASSASPADEYIVFNGVTPPPLIPDLMITRWLQRVAVVRYDLQSLMPAPIRWEPDPATVHPGPAGRLWLVIQRHAAERSFPGDGRAAYQSALTARLGQPQFFDRFDLPNGETWTIWAYPASPHRRPEPANWDSMHH